MFTNTTTIRMTKPTFARKRVFAIALAAGALLAAPASALAVDNNPADPGVRCAAKVGPGQYEFYLPGGEARRGAGGAGERTPAQQDLRGAPNLNAHTKRETMTPGRTASLTVAELKRPPNKIRAHPLEPPSRRAPPTVGSPLGGDH